MAFGGNFAIIWAAANKRLAGRAGTFSRIWLSGAVVFSILLAAGFERSGLISALADTLPSPTMVDMLVTITPRCDIDLYGMADEGGESGPGFVEITVSIPPGENRKVGEVQWPQQLPPNPAHDFITVKTEVVERKSAETWLHKSVSKSRDRSVLVFVHPIENGVENAAFRFAQIVHDSGTQSTPLLATWPSNHKSLGVENNPECINYARNSLRLLVQRLVRDPLVNELSILTHSRGNQAVMEALDQIAVRSGALPPKLKNVMLTAGNLDLDTFLFQIADMGEPRPMFTIFILPEGDNATVSNGGDNVARPGSVDLESNMSLRSANNVTVIDVTAVRSEDLLRHGKFAASPEIVQLFGARFSGGQVFSDER